jgi:hypothetical protein
MSWNVWMKGIVILLWSWLNGRKGKRILRMFWLNLKNIIGMRLIILIICVSLWKEYCRIRILILCKLGWGLCNSWIMDWERTLLILVKSCFLLLLKNLRILINCYKRNLIKHFRISFILCLLMICKRKLRIQWKIKILCWEVMQ